MAKEFVRLNKKRVRISTIKRYEPLDDTKIVIRFSVNPNSPNSETFDLKDEDVRDRIISILDEGLSVN